MDKHDGGELLVDHDVSTRWWVVFLVAMAAECGSSRTISEVDQRVFNGAALKCKVEFLYSQVAVRVLCEMDADAA